MKVQLNSPESAENWFDDVVNPEKYDIYYVGPEKKIVLMKNVSTSPRIHGVIDNNTPQPVAEEFARKYSRPFTVVDSLDWVSFRPEFDSINN